MKRKTIDLMEFEFKVPAQMKRLSEMERYKTPFVIETHEGEVHTVIIGSRANGEHYFINNYDVVFPSEVAFIEDRIWDHIKA
ncbi:hypothetical protein CPT_Muldoon_032 [Serratia phage Muldoon]|uniref:Uncharacterized protein n=1 Tax=Serratia phage Muldoon TaxID=2601678 RepID=A0A5P8PH41_9CAUD|nr:hypothetical protein HYP94_gp032 [Serratia phage Muldoon]QFR55989.1 hypothetical protein CPT_Muldoon_032 [Serratia phage Muldoon]WDS61576.1 hypothetical protein [Cronobacter phage vB_Cdu_VP8]